MRKIWALAAVVAAGFAPAGAAHGQGCYGGGPSGYSNGGGLSVPLQVDFAAPRLRFAPGFAGGYFDNGGYPPVPYGAPPWGGGGFYQAGGFNGGYSRPFGAPAGYATGNGYAGRPRVSEGRIDGNGRLY